VSECSLDVERQSLVLTSYFLLYNCFRMGSQPRTQYVPLSSGGRTNIDVSSRELGGCIQQGGGAGEGEAGMVSGSADQQGGSDIEIDDTFGSPESFFDAQSVGGSSRGSFSSATGTYARRTSTPDLTLPPSR